MKNKILLLSISLLALFSCTSTYRSGQTPDDVYYSPLRNVSEEDKDDDEDVAETNEDRQIRMTIRDRRWRVLDDRYGHNCGYNPYYYGYTYGYYYNPYFYPYPVHNGTFQTVSNLPIRTTNLASYNNTPYTTIRNPKTGATRSSTTRSYNRRNSSDTRETINTGNSNNNTRTYSPSSSGSSRGSGTTINRPARN